MDSFTMGIEIDGCKHEDSIRTSAYIHTRACICMSMMIVEPSNACVLYIV